MWLLSLECEHTVVSEINPTAAGTIYVLCPRCVAAKERGVNIPLCWQKMHKKEDTNDDVRDLLRRFPFILPEDILRVRPEQSQVQLRAFPYVR